MHARHAKSQEVVAAYLQRFGSRRSSKQPADVSGVGQRLPARARGNRTSRHRRGWAKRTCRCGGRGPGIAAPRAVPSHSYHGPRLQIVGAHRLAQRRACVAAAAPQPRKSTGRSKQQDKCRTTHPSVQSGRIICLIVFRVSVVASFFISV
jgi:hypothetical protein